MQAATTTPLIQKHCTDCKNYGNDLCRYDVNKPSKGKDQCDLESASAKTILRIYLQAENDILTADDIAEGMFHGFGVQSAEICVAMNEQTKTSFTGKKTKNFTSCHSFEFKETGMIAWRYFRIDEDVFIPYVETSFRPAGFAVRKPSIKTKQKKRLQAQGKAREDFDLHLFFCDEAGCAQIFEDREEYEIHCLIA